MILIQARQDLIANATNLLAQVASTTEEQGKGDSPHHWLTWLKGLGPQTSTVFAGVRDGSHLTPTHPDLGY